MMTPSSETSWRPPSPSLDKARDLWRAKSVSAVSYPEAGNEVCFQVEPESYWFQHRNECILTAVRRFPAAGTLFDIGGGNGFVTLALQQTGTDAVLVEPGRGADNALQRGVQKVIQATLEDANFAPHSLPAAGAFDVLEHIPDDAAFLRRLHEKLAPGGRFYCTVPASRLLWSYEDDYAGHFRRYTRASLERVLQRAGFAVEFASYFFTWLALPVLFFRVLPSQLRLHDASKLGTLQAVRSDHRLPHSLTPLVGRMQEWELQRIRAGRRLPLGTSLLCVARARP